MNTQASRYPNYRFPMIEVSHQTIKDWNGKFAGQFAAEIRRRRRKPTHRWHIDEMHVKIKGKKCYLWRAIDDEGTVLDILVTERRNKDSARRFFKKVLGSYRRPTKVTSDRLSSYKSVIREEAPKTKHLRGKRIWESLAQIPVAA